MGAAEQAQADDRIERVEFEPVRRDLGQVPARRGCRTADPTPAIEQTVPFEDAPDGADGWDTRLAVFEQVLADGGRPALAEQPGRECPAGLEDEGFGLLVGPSRPVRGRRAIGPVDVVGGASSGSGKGALNGPQADPEANRDRALRGSAADRPDQRPTAFLNLAGGSTFSTSLRSSDRFHATVPDPQVLAPRAVQ